MLGYFRHFTFFHFLLINGLSKKNTTPETCFFKKEKQVVSISRGKKIHTFFWGGGAYFCLLDHELAHLGANKKTHEFRFAQPPSAIAAQHHLANELTFAALRGVSWMPSCGSMRPFLGQWHRKFMIPVDGNQKSGRINSPVDNMACISQIIYSVVFYMSGGCSISSINSMSSLKLGRQWLKDGENGIQI